VNRRMLAALLAVLAVSGCDFFAPDPEAASLPPVFGARVTDGKLRLWTGTPCSGVSRVVVTFSPDGARLVLEPPAGKSADVDFLTLDGPYPALDLVESMPDGFDWHTAKTVLMLVDSPQGTGSTPTDVAEIVDGSADHPDYTYYFQGIGWLDAAQVAAENRKSLLTVCTADPNNGPR
jgi:hypothetical protein